MDRSSAYRHRNESPEFAARWDSAAEIGRDVMVSILEDEADYQAIVGLDRLKFDKYGDALTDPRTGAVYLEKQKNANLLMFRLKKLDPAYRDNAPTAAPNAQESGIAAYVDALQGTVSEVWGDEQGELTEGEPQ
jgi:hypothetical protein